MENTEVVKYDTGGTGLRLGALETAGPAAVLARATDIATALADIINQRHLYRQIGQKRHVYVEGWSTLGAMLGVIPREMDGKTEKIDEDTWLAWVELVRVSDGAIVGRGSAICSRKERNWSDRDEYAIRSMAITRATGKAYRLAFSWIIQLAGYEPTPAEEMPDTEREKPKPQRKPANPEPQGRPTKKEIDATPRPWNPELLRWAMLEKANGKDSPASDKQIKYVNSSLNNITGSDDGKRRSLMAYFYGVESSKDLTSGQASALIDWVGATADNEWTPCGFAIEEAERVIRARVVELGQTEMGLEAEA